MAALKDLGKYPVSGPKGREDMEFYKLTAEDGIMMISGKRTPALLNVWASNDVVQFGDVTVLTGGCGPQQTETDSHPGDTVFYVLEGPVTFYFPERKETFDVQEGDFMFIPEKEAYKIINYTGKTIKALFTIAPEF